MANFLPTYRSRGIEGQNGIIHIEKDGFGERLCHSLLCPEVGRSIVSIRNQVPTSKGVSGRFPAIIGTINSPILLGTKISDDD